MIEYAIIRCIDESHPIILHQLRMIIIYLSSYKFIRPPDFVAKMIGFDKKFPGIYTTLNEISYDILTEVSDIIQLSSIYHINMYIII